MLPDVHHPVWAQFVTGKKRIQSNKATINMMIHSNQMSYERDGSPANVQDLVSKTHSFFAKFESIFGDEIAQMNR